MRREEAAEVLGCAVDSAPEEIRAQYRKLSMKMHPDRPGGSEELFVRLSEAYNTLTEKMGVEREAITADAFQRFKSMYEGSEEEKNELVALYKKHKGQMSKIIDSLLLGEDEQESRYREILDACIKKEALQEYPKYRAKPLMANKKRQAKREKEKEAAEALAKDLESRAEERKARYSQMIERLEEMAAAPKKKRNR
ncbi:DnaJ-like protein subfamily C member 9 [Nematocida major]|uniref:DnaJ-like protein subfamily C member 9 n=1 Tax=Nematocida major TaxID=1912982 RepID=UPI0020082924|nr:DnaJ-like protein subfamily C member 9 [Nematocida major]KAH9386319.1 DnaJ-like protein subfamily C member 9 [Nematocida major]